MTTQAPPVAAERRQALAQALDAARRFEKELDRYDQAEDAQQAVRIADRLRAKDEG